MRKNILTFVFSLCTTVTIAQTQYDYYDDEVYFDRVDPTYLFLGLIMLAVVIIAFVILCSILINIYYWVNPKASPKYKQAEANRQKLINEEQLIKEKRSNAVFEAIDLGLSVKWASFNLGAYKESDFGDTFYWSNICKDQPSPSYPANNVNVIGDFSGDPNYDAATYILGDCWRTPTSEECKELVNSCRWEDCIIDNVGGKKIIGPNGNSIFLPNNQIDYTTKQYISGNYWTSSPSFSRHSGNTAQDLRFFSNSEPEIFIGATANRCKFGIRPVFSIRPRIKDKTFSKVSSILEMHEQICEQFDLSKYEELKEKSIWTEDDSNVIFKYGYYYQDINTDKYFIDQYGVIYSRNDNRLITAEYCTSDIYEVREGTVIICEDALFKYHNFALRPSKRIKKLILPKSIQYISGKYIPDDCEIVSQSQNYLIIDNLLIDIRRLCLVKCLNSFIQTFMIPDQIQEIDSWAFKDCVALSEVFMPNSLRIIRHEAFWGCKYLAKVHISDNVKVIEDRAFGLCENLVKIKLPEKLEILGNGALINTKVEQIEIPSSLNILGAGVFPRACKEIRSFSDQYVIENSMLIDRRNSELVFYIDGQCEVFITPLNIKSIRFGALFGSSFRKAIVTSNITELPKSLFAGCKKLSEVVLPDCISTLPESCFSGCYSLINYEIPESITTIGCAAFSHCHNLKVVKMSNKINSIGSYAFHACSCLEKIYLPQSVSKLGKNCFEECMSLSRIYYNCNKCDIESSFGQKLQSLDSIEIGENVTFIGTGFCTNNDKITKVVIPQSVAHISSKAFVNLKNLDKIIIYNRRIKLEKQWIKGCDNLQAIYIYPTAQNEVMSSLSDNVIIKYISLFNIWML